MLKRAMLTRFAPSPTGYLHLGHALAAYEAFSFANKQGGECLLRIEDIDHTRCKPEYTQAIYDDLEWLGFNWPKPARVQSQHISGYQKALETLKMRELLYPCFLTRSEIKSKAPGGIYRGPKTRLSQCELEDRLAQGETPAWRLSLARCHDVLGAEFASLDFKETGEHLAPAPFGDEVLARKDIGLSYHLCAVHDDAMQKITHIVRGVDIAPHTRFHVLLQKLMGYPTPAYHHHKLLLNKDGEKLAKRNADTSIRELRASGLSPQEILDLARGLG